MCKCIYIFYQHVTWSKLVYSVAVLEVMFFVTCHWLSFKPMTITYRKAGK